MSHKTARFVSDLLYAISIFLLCIAAFIKLPETAMILLIIIAFAIILAALIIRCLFWRCPYCHEILPLNSMYSIVYCPDCGKKIW